MVARLMKWLVVGWMADFGCTVGHLFSTHTSLF